MIKPGDIQRMSAGSGVTHSEYNHSKDDGVHFLQIWFFPEEKGIEPSYEQKSFDHESKRGNFKLVMSRDGRNESVKINQDVDMYVSLLNGDDTVEHKPVEGRVQWLQVARRQVDLNGQTLKAGDGAVIVKEEAIKLSQASDAEILLFNMIA